MNMVEEGKIQSSSTETPSEKNAKYDPGIWSRIGDLQYKPYVSNGAEKEPLSSNFPDETDEQNNSRLIDELHKQGGYESKEGHDLRVQILGDLEQMLSKWAVEYIRRKKSETVAASAACQIIPFGSFCIGVHTAESDIDVLCVVPKFVSRNDFFSEIPQLLADSTKVDKSTLLTVFTLF